MAEESKLQTKIIKYLQQNGWLVVKIKLASLPGWPDLVLIKDGRVVWLEIKSSGKKPDPLQYHRMLQIQDHGGNAYWVDSWTKFLKLKL